MGQVVGKGSAVTLQGLVIGIYYLFMLKTVHA